MGPAPLTIEAGDTVTGTNDDTAPQDVKTTSAPVALHSPLFGTHTFTVPGTYRHVCTVHPGMAATLIVKAGPSRVPRMCPPPRGRRRPRQAPTV